MTDDTLLDALDRLRGTGPEYDGFLSNHGPMAAEALTRLGAAAAVPGWVSRYRTRLGDAPGGGRGGGGDWRRDLGDWRRLGDWTDRLRRESRETTWTALLHRWWPRLLPGLGAGATHGMIRTAHAVRSLRLAQGDPDPLLVDELAQGLAYWAARYLALPGDPRLAGDLDAVTATAALPRLDPGVPDDGPGIVGRLRVLGHLPALPDALDGWGAPADPQVALDELVGAAARVLAARPDAPIAFCHTVTAPAAIRLVLPVLPPPWRVPAVAAAWQVVGAVVAAYASPRTAEEARAVTDVDPAPLLRDLAPRAVEHGDEHVIKLTEAVLREYERVPDATLLVAADRFRDRLG